MSARPRKIYTPVSVKRRLEKARAARDRAYDAIARLAIENGLGNIPFSECRKHFAPELGEALDIANRNLTEMEADAVHNGHAWRGTFGGINFYS